MSQDQTLASLAMALDEQPAETTTITVDQLNKLIETIALLKEQYDEAKKLSNEAHAKVEAKKMEVMNILDALGQKSFNAPFGTITCVTEKRYKLPSEITGKEEVFEYIREKHGEEVYFEMLTINHDKFNSFVKAEVEEGASVPGVGAVSVETYPKFSKAKGR